MPTPVVESAYFGSSTEPQDIMVTSKIGSGSTETLSTAVPPGKRPHPDRIALSKAESVLISSAGDVLVCRCRKSPFPGLDDAVKGVEWRDELAVLCCDAECDDLSVEVQEAAICSPWGTTGAVHDPMSRGGLMGGAPAEVASPLHHHHDDGLLGGGGYYAEHEYSEYGDVRASPDMSAASAAQRAFRSPPLDDSNSSFDADSIVPITSFDYSHYRDGGNDMIPALDRQKLSPERASTKSPQEQRVPPPFFHHGVPSFLPAFHQVNIKQVSAHPMGLHVLLISDAGLLYSYGLNEYGQLGIGIRTPVRGFHRGFIMTPTIVTPIIENGGKAVACAAGVNHSLVVVQTEERRLMRSKSMVQLPTTPEDRSPVQIDSRSSEPVVHHQLYGFGRNDFMKIGLVSPKVAKPGKADKMECVVAPRRVALRCRVTSDTSDAVSPPHGIFQIAASMEHSAALVHRKNGDVELYTWGNATHGALGIPKPRSSKGQMNSSPQVVPVPSFVASLSRTSNPDARSKSMLWTDYREYPTSLSLGHRSSFVLTSLGRCFSFGESQDGMLGLGPQHREVSKPMQVPLRVGKKVAEVISVSAGKSHVVAVTSTQEVYTWGLPNSGDHSMAMSEENAIEWAPRKVAFPPEASKIVEAKAGNDCSLFVSCDGQVLSSGKASGRLGLGAIGSDVEFPCPLFGGLRLWKAQTQSTAKIPLKRNKLLRGDTFS